MPYSNRGGNDGDGNSRSWRLILFFKIFYFKRRWFVFTSDVVVVAVFFYWNIVLFSLFRFSVCNWISIPFYWRCLYYRVFNVSLEVWLFIVISFYFVSLEFFLFYFWWLDFGDFQLTPCKMVFSLSLSVCMSELLIINARAIKFMPI